MGSFKGNRVVRDTGSEYPIFQAPIGGMSRAQWAGAVSAAGGMGLMETAMQGSAELDAEAERIRSQTNRPFGYHLLSDWLAVRPDHERDIMAWLTRRRPAFVTIGTSGKMRETELDSWRHVEQVKDLGAKCYFVVETLEEALRSEDKGVDGLILSGAEAGGVRGENYLHIFAFIQQVRKRTGLPLVASGGIVDGRGMAGAFALGAEGVLMGTRFMAAKECPIHDDFKRTLIEAEQMMYLPFGPPEAQMVVVRTPYAEAVARGEINPDGNPYAGDALRCFYEGRTDLAMVGAGESAVLLDEVKPVQAIVEETIEGFWQELERLAALRGGQS